MYIYRIWRRISGLNEIVLAVLLCNAVEHYDFIIFGILSSTINKVFFAQGVLPSSQGSHAAYLSELIGFLVFASAFVARPLGAAVFGYLGDRKGRKIVLNISASMLIGSVLCMAVLPTPLTWGIFSPLVLTILRVVQGLAYGAEIGGVVLMAESADSSKVRVIWVCRIAFCNLGLFLGTFVVRVCETLFTELQMYEWGWRIPFLVAVVIGLPLPYLRSKIRESRDYVEYKSTGSRTNIFESLVENIGAVLLVFVMAATSSGFFYLATIYIDLSHRLSYPEYVVSLLLASLASCLSLFASDASKRRGYFLVMMACIIVSLYPVVYFIYKGSVIACTAFFIMCGAYVGWYGSFIALIFPVGCRQTCFSLPYGAGYLAGALSPAICLWFSHATGLSTAPAFYLIFFATIVSLMVAFCLRVENGVYRFVSPMRKKTESSLAS
ncbi:MFS transporter [Anaplasma capra]|uniref:MFS transporter n=1 Tax=Anaplasma capra TaxID=1562740 RepID=UPI0021D5EAB7|nr:MFS transporter [Anaplasma capra]MCU7611432.1 MFS transporter [Anaplasma capra]MCU7612129.1 MFS transporter [Anaplasma capra]